MLYSGLPAGFCAAKKYIYEPLGFQCAAIKQDEESKEYGACTFEMNGKRVLFREAKITPTKRGLFVTLWKRSPQGPIVPYDSEDIFDICIVHISEGNRFGQFIFPKEALLRHGVFSKNGKGGKRAMRVYPAWTVVDNKQAEKTQAWQVEYFFESNKAVLDEVKIRRLIS